MVKGDVIFCASGVTSGDLAKGIKNFEDKFVENCYEAQESFRLRARRCAPESRCRKVDAAFSVIHS